ncbi:MAG: tetratricopeptide repeat protein, partial [Pseudanabaena sp.]
MMTAQYQAALHSYAEGQYEEAMQQFSELLYEDPRNPKLHIWLGATFRKAGKIEYAKVQYQKVLTLTDDPDLLDLANTSLAQIQNKLALSAQKAESIKSASKDPDSSHKLHEPSSQQKIPQVMYPQVNAILGTSRLADNGIASNSDLAESSEDQTLLLDSNGNVPNNVSVSKPQNAIKISNGVVPPPPVIASLLNKQQQVIMPEEHSSETLIFSDKTMEWSTNPLAPSSVLQDTIATLQNNKS